ncbi:isocitrate lyase/PEP mutase family protein [Caulobacter sp.]|uniref:isocitrate lyase/PEP mutase family protein n=1 Tax=Caulobacter sp. TaxID=78 RepID=UPI003BA98093
MVSAPGCWDGLSALLIEQAAFQAAFLTGGGLAMARFGRPDMGLVDAGEVEQTIAIIRDRVALPLIVDGDTGFGNALNMQRTVRRFERAGASAIQIEDQLAPKRCGHMAGKAMVSKAEAVGKLNAALDAREHALIIARTDAVSVEGFDAAIDRAEAYLEAGADLIFVEGPRTLADTAALGSRFGQRVPLVHNLVEGGTTAVRGGPALQALGFAIALHPLLLLHGFAKAAPGWLATLRDTGSTDAIADQLADLSAMNILTGAPDLLAAAQRYGDGA